MSAVLPALSVLLYRGSGSTAPLPSWSIGFSLLWRGHTYFPKGFPSICGKMKQQQCCKNKKDGEKIN